MSVTTEQAGRSAEVGWALQRVVAAEGERAEAMRTREKELAAVKIAPGTASPPP